MYIVSVNLCSWSVIICLRELSIISITLMAWKLHDTWAYRAFLATPCPYVTGLQVFVTILSFRAIPYRVTWWHDTYRRTDRVQCIMLPATERGPHNKLLIVFAVTWSDYGRVRPDCRSSEYGCCYDDQTPALGRHMAGCARTLRYLSILRDESIHADLPIIQWTNVATAKLLTLGNFRILWRCLTNTVKIRH